MVTKHSKYVSKKHWQQDTFPMERDWLNSLGHTHITELYIILKIML